MPWSWTAPLSGGSAYQIQDFPSLPANLKAATDKMANSSIAHELLGAEFVEHFVETRYWEWQEFEKAVTDWESRRYFELI